MIQLQQNRYLWVHVVSLAAVPLLLDICLAGLASAGPALAFGGQFWAIALLGTAPAFAMQCFKPFYVFSLPPLALKPAALSEDQRRCLTIFKSWQIKALAGVVAVFSVWVLGKLYGMLPQVSPLLTPRAGLICGAVAFFFAATFMQISVSAIRALLIGPDALKRVKAADGSAITSDFLILGIPVKRLLPEPLLVETYSLEVPDPEIEPPAEADNRPTEMSDQKIAVEDESIHTVEDHQGAEEPEEPEEIEETQETVATAKTEEGFGSETMDDEIREEVEEDATLKIEELELVIPEALPPDKRADSA